MNGTKMISKIWPWLSETLRKAERKDMRLWRDVFILSAAEKRI